MRLFQINHFYGRYLQDFYARTPDHDSSSHSALVRELIEDRFDGTHVLEPVQQYAPEARWVVSNDKVSQFKWAAEHGLKAANLEQILLSQIEEHRAEVVYNLNPYFPGSDFIRGLPGCVKKAVCYYAAPLGKADLSAFDLCLTSHPPFVQMWKEQGLHAALFLPSHDPVMAPHAASEDRPVDICFVGSYSTAHRRRNELLSAMAALAERFSVVFALIHPRFRPLCDTRFLRRIPSPFPYLPALIRKVAGPPVFGRKLYELLGRTKVVFNAAIDMAGEYRGNMRCFEAMGCGACMLSDQGKYPEGFVEGQHLLCYEDVHEAVQKAEGLLQKPDRARSVGQKAARMVASRYSKHSQWTRFQELVECF